jgi:CubicO group peptidase (beta-lactamase class C family)
LILATATVTALSVAALTAAWPSDAPRVATGFVADVLCSQTFVSGLDPQQVFAETTAAMPGTGLIDWGLTVEVDRNRKQVTTTLFGLAASRAVYRDGLGCYLAQDNGPVDAVLPAKEPLPPPVLPPIAGAAPVKATDVRLEQALDRVFYEPEQPFRHTRAVVVVKDGHIIAERYAAGIGVDTQLLGYSMSKSVTSALIGVLVRQGRLALDQPAPVPLWQNPDDPRHAITIDHLLRHTAGLAVGSSLQATLGSAFDKVNQMKFVERDMAGYAENAALETAPGSAWNYNDANYLILSRLIRDAVGGHAADVLQFATRELFGPLGMRNVTLQFDATGTAEGASKMLASARDWARFGMLYLDDGVVGGRRILPEGWVRYSATPTPNGWVGYGAGWWTNLGDSLGASKRIGLGMPRDAIHARGQFGQYTVVVPSQRLVIVRLGTTGGDNDIAGVARLVTDLIAATGQSGQSATH